MPLLPRAVTDGRLPNEAQERTDPHRGLSFETSIFRLMATQRTMFKSCCEWLKNAMDAPGEKGYSVLAFREEETRVLLLQARPFERALDTDPLSSKFPQARP